MNATAASSGIIGQLLQVVRREVGQRLLFKPTPKVFHRIKFRSVRWKETNVDTRRFTEKLTNLFRSVWQEAIPDDEGRGFELTIQLSKESPHLRGVEVIVHKESEVKIHTLSFWRNAQRRYCRNFLVRASSLRQNRCISTRRPGSTNEGSHKQAAFVYEDNKGFKPCCFF